MKLTKQDVEYAAKLARVALTEDEKERFTQQLGDIMGHFEKLQELDTSNVEPTAHPFSSGNVWRKDEAKPWGDTESILANAPAREEQFFRVNKVIE